MMIKLISATALISAIAVILGFYGTHLLMNLIDTHKRVEPHFTPKLATTIKRIHEKTNLPFSEIVPIFNETENHHSPIKVSLVSAQDELPKKYSGIKINETFEIPSDLKDNNRPNDQLYNLDGENFLLFKFSENNFKMPSRGEPGPGPGHGPRGGGPSLSMLMVPLSLTFVIILFSLSISAFFILYYLRSQAQKAASVLQALKLGDLKARFPIARVDEASELMHEFNLMADEIEHLVGDLRDTDSMRRSLLQELAHDLRTPIASMKSLLESLQFQGERMTREQTQENIKVALTEVDYFHHLVEDLLFLSGVHDLKFRAKFSPVSLVEIILHEVQVANETSSKNIKFSSDEFFEISGNSFLIQRLIKNAISNATSNALDTVVISFDKTEDSLQLTIVDDGPGLSAEAIASFGQKRGTRKIDEHDSNKISIGLGAVIMQKICDIHSGQMKISNIEKDNIVIGAALRFRFPTSSN